MKRTEKRKRYFISMCEFIRVAEKEAAYSGTGKRKAKKAKIFNQAVDSVSNTTEDRFAALPR